MGNKVYKICNKCGKEIDENSAFCNFCVVKTLFKFFINKRLLQVVITLPINAY